MGINDDKMIIVVSGAGFCCSVPGDSQTSEASLVASLAF